MTVPPCAFSALAALLLRRHYLFLVSFVLSFSFGHGFDLVLDFAITVAIGAVNMVAIALALGSQSERQRFSGSYGPAAVESQAHLPYAAGKAIEISVTIVMVRMSDDDVEPQARVENKLNTADLLTPMPVCGGMRGRPVAHSPARKMIDVGRRA